MCSLADPLESVNVEASFKYCGSTHKVRGPEPASASEGNMNMRYGSPFEIICPCLIEQKPARCEERYAQRSLDIFLPYLSLEETDNKGYRFQVLSAADDGSNTDW